MIALRIFLLFNFILLCEYSYVQSPSYIHYEVGNGLTSNELYSLKQDSKGFLWIGTDAGLTRFNGYNFELYTHKLQKGASVTGIQEDSKGNIWCHNFSGQVFVFKNDSLSIFTPWNKYYNNQLIEIAIDNKDNLYISNFKNSIYKFQTNTNALEIIGDNDLVKQSVFSTTNNDVIYSNLSLKKIYNIKQQELYLNGIPNLPAQDSVYNAFVYFNSTLKKQTFGFQRQHYNDKFPSLYYFENSKLTIHPITSFLRENNIYPISLLSDDVGNIFIGTFKGCYWFKYEKNQWIFEKLLFENMAISSIIKDKEGSYWFATLKNGLYQIPNLDIKVFEQKHLKFTDNISGALATDNRNIYVAGLSKEIAVIDAATYKLKNVQFTSDVRDVQGFFYDTTFKRLLYFKNNLSILKNGITKNYEKILSAAKNFFVRKDGVIFSAGVTLVALYPKNYDKRLLQNEFESTKGLSLFDNNIDTSIFKLFILSNQRSRGVWYNYKYKILWSADADGAMFFASKKKTKFYDTATKQIIIATSFTEDSNGNVYIGTIENGIYKVDGTRIIQHYTTKDGLIGNRIKKITINNDNLYVISSIGLQKINLKTNVINNLTVSDGLGSSEVVDIAIALNKVFVTTSKGLQVLPESFTNKNVVPPYLSISKFSSSDSIYSLNSHIKIPASKSNISILLDGVALKSRGSFKYKYRLIGLDSSWITVAANANIVRYPTLPAGDYVFEVTILNEDDVSGNVQKIEFKIIKPWYLQLWFLALMLLTSMVVIFAITNNILTKKRKQVEEALKQSQIQEALRKSQLSSLKAQMNPHFMFNALNSIQEFILLNDKKQANMFMGKFADLMRLTLDHSNKETISLNDEIRILQFYLQLESLRFEEQFFFSINQENIIDSQAIQIPAMIIQPYVENAIKHGLLHKQGVKKVEIIFYEKEENLICTVIDNGIGRKRSQEINELRQKKYTSFATGATQKRLELLNYNKPKLIVVQYKDLYSNEVATGTKVEIIIPFHR